MANSGIYQIRNLINGKIYIGSAVDFKERWTEGHRKNLRANNHCNQYLQNAWNKYGEQNFIFERLEEVNEDKLIEREQWYIDNTNCMKDKHGYNICPTAGNTLGRICKEETKKKIGDANRGKKRSEEVKTKMVESLIGRKHTEETKRKIGEAQRGEKSNNVKLSNNQIKEIRNLYTSGNVIMLELAKLYNVTNQNIHKIVTHKSWKHIG